MTIIMHILYSHLILINIQFYLNMTFPLLGISDFLLSKLNIASQRTSHKGEVLVSFYSSF